MKQLWLVLDTEEIDQLVAYNTEEEAEQEYIDIVIGELQAREESLWLYRLLSDGSAPHEVRIEQARKWVAGTDLPLTIQQIQYVDEGRID